MMQRERPKNYLLMGTILNSTKLGILMSSISFSPLNEYSFTPNKMDPGFTLSHNNIK